MPDYKRNHYVPVWYQKRFLARSGAPKLYYLDLAPERRESRGVQHYRRSVRHLGPKNCFFENDLYTTRLGSWSSTEIESEFFGSIDTKGKAALEYFARFEHPAANGRAFEDMVRYLSTQKLRTPKGLANLARATGVADRNQVLMNLQRLQLLYGAIWSESNWSIADASKCSVKFLISDHPVTAYNRKVFPGAKQCRGHRDPEVTLCGTHTLFPLDADTILLLTNNAWLYDPYQNPLRVRPNPTLLRETFFNFQQIQTGRELSDEEVVEINYIIKSRAFRYVAAAEKAWLYPEGLKPNLRWDRLGRGYLCMPDPRSATMGGEIYFGSGGRTVAAFDKYGRRPGDEEFGGERTHNHEWATFCAFQGEFARVFGPRRRGRSHELGQLSPAEDSPEFHRYHLAAESWGKGQLRGRSSRRPRRKRGRARRHMPKKNLQGEVPK